jgi:hypothetical protein
VGRDYLGLLADLHRRLRPRTYLEIGVADGRSLALARSGTVAVGVDPQPRIGVDLPASARVVEATSDEFFASTAREEVFGDLPVDLAFIDGLHWFEVALRDFDNVERWCAPGSTILVHDWLPIDEASAERECTTFLWTGDVWKTAMILREARPDLDLVTVDVPPSGLGIVRRLDPSSAVLRDRYEELVERWRDVPFSFVDRDRAALLNVVPDDC